MADEVEIDSGWGCEHCGAAMRWESLFDDDHERWLGICECGRFRAFFPDDPSATPTDPLSAFLGRSSSNLRPPSPPWIRIFQISSTFPWHVDWRYRPSPCPACGAGVLFETFRTVSYRFRVYCVLCLSCGCTSAERLHASGLSETPLTGREWIPACPAVARLREAVFGSLSPVSPQ